MSGRTSYIDLSGCNIRKGSNRMRRACFIFSLVALASIELRTLNHSRGAMLRHLGNGLAHDLGMQHQITNVFSSGCYHLSLSTSIRPLHYHGMQRNATHAEATQYIAMRGKPYEPHPNWSRNNKQSKCICPPCIQFSLKAATPDIAQIRT